MEGRLNWIFLDQILPLVKKPARYAGGEWNAVRKDWESVEYRVAFAFPDVYEVGMSHLGLQILYDIVNRRTDTLMERVFAPWTDMEEIMRNTVSPCLPWSRGGPCWISTWWPLPCSTK